MNSFRHHASVPSRAGVGFAQCLQDMLRQLGIALAPGPAADAYTLRFADEPDVYVMSTAAGTALLAAREAGVVPLAPSAAMLTRLLALNHQPAGDIDVTVGLDAKSGTVVVSSRHRLSAIDAALFKHILDAIRHRANAVQHILAGASTPGSRQPSLRSWQP